MQMGRCLVHMQMSREHFLVGISLLKSPIILIRNSKQERTAELEQLGAKIEEKQDEFNVLSERVLNYDDGLEKLRNVEEMLDNAPEYQLSEPQGFMSAKAYKTKIAEPLIQKFIYLSVGCALAGERLSGHKIAILSSYSKKTPTSKVGDQLRLLPT